MAIIPIKKEERKPTYRYSLIILILVAILASLAVFFWPVQLPENYKGAILSRTEEKLSELEFNLAVLQDPVFQSLTSYGEFPLTVKDGGRANPFSL